MIHTAFFGDGEHSFALPTNLIEELEKSSGSAVGAIYTQLLSAQPRFSDLTAIVRLGLIGGGASPAQAKQLIDAYVEATPIVELFALALDVLGVRWNGPQPAKEQPKEQTLAEAMDEAYADFIGDGETA